MKNAKIKMLNSYQIISHNSHCCVRHSCSSLIVFKVLYGKFLLYNIVENNKQTTNHLQLMQNIIKVIKNVPTNKPSSENTEIGNKKELRRNI